MKASFCHRKLIGDRGRAIVPSTLLPSGRLFITLEFTILLEIVDSYYMLKGLAVIGSHSFGATCYLCCIVSYHIVPKVVFQFNNILYDPIVSPHERLTTSD